MLKLKTIDKYTPSGWAKSATDTTPFVHKYGKKAKARGKLGGRRSPQSWLCFQCVRLANKNVCRKRVENHRMEEIGQTEAVLGGLWNPPFQFEYCRAESSKKVGCGSVGDIPMVTNTSQLWTSKCRRWVPVSSWPMWCMKCATRLGVTLSVTREA